jgi:hypothetical protein
MVMTIPGSLFFSPLALRRDIFPHRPTLTGPPEPDMAIKVEKLSLPAYLVASLLILFPVLDTTAQLFPLDTASLQGRYGALGLASQALMTPLLGLLLLSVTARMAGHARMLWLLGLLSFGAALLCLGLAGLFCLDWLDMRELVPAEAQSAFRVSFSVALAKYLVVGLIAALLGRAAMKEAGALRKRAGPASGERAEMVYKAREEGQERAGEQGGEPGGTPDGKVEARG